MEFKKEWDEWDFVEARIVIRKFLKSRKFDTNRGKDTLKSVYKFQQIDRIIGLAYTSSSAITAMYICSVILFLDEEHKYQIRGFALDKDDWCFYALCEDKNENTFYIMI